MISHHKLRCCYKHPDSRFTALKRLGLVVSAGTILEQLSFVDHIVFDKTGTLTEGSLKVSEVTLLATGWIGAKVLDYCSALEIDSRHPVARAFKSVVRGRFGFD